MWCARVSFSFLNHSQAPTHSRPYHPSTNDHDHLNHHYQNEQGRVIELFIVQDLCKGGTLREVVQDQMITVGRQMYSLRTAVSWALDVAKALRYLHRCKPPVVHRDLKLENVILSTPFKKSGVVWRGDEPADSHPPAKLADFGLATFVDHGMKIKRLFKNMKTSKEGNPLGENSSKVVRMLERMRTLSSFGGSDETGDKSEHARSASNDDDGNDVTGVAGSFGYMAPEVGIESDAGRVRDPNRSLTHSLARALRCDRSPGVQRPGGYLRKGTRPPRPQALTPSRPDRLVHSLTRSLAHSRTPLHSLVRQHYNEKVDVFSFGVMLYNLCYRVIPALQINPKTGETEDMNVYVQRVSMGWRQQLNDARVPALINDIIGACWSQDPKDRPSMSDVVTRLEAVLADPTVDLENKKTGSFCCCF